MASSFHELNSQQGLGLSERGLGGRMKENGFLKEYHEYVTQDRNEAVVECVKVNLQAEGFVVVVQGFPGLGFCLMLKTANDALKEMGVV